MTTSDALPFLVENNNILMFDEQEYYVIDYDHEERWLLGENHKKEIIQISYSVINLEKDYFRNI